MLYSIANNRHPYGSDIYLPLASKKRYVLEGYPPRTRRTPEYNPLYDTFRPITPPHFNPQFQDRRTSIYDQPCAHYFHNEQHISPYNRNLGK